MPKKRTARRIRTDKSKHTAHLPRSVRRLFPNVEFASDADMPIEVNVSTADCKSGRGSDPAECALAKAVKREFQADGAIIGLGASYIIRGKQAIRFDTPQHIKREIISFDRHGDFEPGSYKLMPKSPAARFGKRRDRSGEPVKPGSHAPLRAVHRRTARVRFLNVKDK